MTDVVRVSALTAEQRHVVAALLDAAAAADGVDPLSEQAVLALAHSGPDVEHYVVPTGDVTGASEATGDVTGASEATGDGTGASAYGNVLVGRDGEQTMAELVVAPDRRRDGLGTALLTAILADHPRARFWAHGDLPGAQALAASAGLSSQRVLLQLRRPLDDLADLPDLPERNDIIVRTYAGVEDDAEILRVNNAAFDWHPEQGGWTPDDIAARTGSDWFDEAGLFLAFDASAPGAQRAGQVESSAPGAQRAGRVESSHKLLGFHWTKVHGPELGEVYIVGVDPDAQGRGLGRYLTLAGLRYLAPLVAECNLYVEGDNTAALHTYERLGFKQYAIDVAYGRE